MVKNGCVSIKFNKDFMAIKFFLKLFAFLHVSSLT